MYSGNQYEEELQQQEQVWQEKELLRNIYKQFYLLIKSNIKSDNINGPVVEIGSGISKINEVIPDCICTSPYETSFCNHIQNAYDLTLEDGSISNLILFDVFHHIRYPGDALVEFRRVLEDKGRLIIFEPCMSLLGLFVYGIFHPEPIGLFNKIEWNNNDGNHHTYERYYAAQANAFRIFDWNKCNNIDSKWNIVIIKKISAISYIASGGYSKKQLYPSGFLPVMRYVDKLCDLIPSLFATRMLIVLEKNI